MPSLRSLFLLAVGSLLPSVVCAETFKVKVGMNSTGQLATVFEPNQITAAAGDMVVFEFMGKNHSVTQSSFAEPCTRQLNTALNLAGADSGFTPVAANATDIPTWTIQLNDASSPQWFFCNQASHCNGGMVFAINAPATGAKSFDAYVAKAKTATHPDPALNQTAPFTPAPAGGSTATGSAGASTGTGAAATQVPGNAAAGTSTGLTSATAAQDQASTSTATPASARSSGHRSRSETVLLPVLAGLLGMLVL